MDLQSYEQRFVCGAQSFRILTSMMYRIQYLLGAMLGIFSLVYILFGIVGWLSSDASFQDVLTCFVLASIHVVAAGGLFIASIRSYRRERARLETVVRVLQERHGGRVMVADVAALADVSQDDAREYLMRNAATRDVVITEGRNGNDAFFFGQQYRNN